MSSPEAIFFLNEQEAADFLDLSSTTLATWRSKGIGPPYVKMRTGTIRYEQSDLVVWMAAQKVVPGDGTAT